MESVLFCYLGFKIVFKGGRGVEIFIVFDFICFLRGYLLYLVEIYLIVLKKKLIMFNCCNY